jgi:NAD+ kinase
MERKIRKILIIVNLKKKEAESTAESIKDYMEKRGIKAIIYGSRENPDIPEAGDIDLAFSLGGDGTVLFSSRVLGPLGVPIMAVNLGDFGFITEVSREEWPVTFEKYVEGKLGISSRIMIRIKVLRNGDKIYDCIGLNDMVISAASISKIVRLSVSLSDTQLGEYRADGVIVSTPTGSTAYSVAAGGPILDPEMDAMVVNPICPFTLSNRTIVVPGDERVRTEVLENQRVELILTVDGQSALHLKPRDVIVVERAEKPVYIIRSDKRNFYEVLRKKLHWSGGSHA